MAAQFLASGIANAQQQRLPVVGFLRSSSLDGMESVVAAFREGLKQTGYVEGQNVVIEFRAAENHADRLSGLIDELARRLVNVIVANASAAAAANKRTRTIPIVFASGGDPVKEKMVDSFGHSGGNITGVAFLNNDLGPKKLELLRELLPKTKTIGILVNANSFASEQERSDVLKAARALGQRIVEANVRTDDDFEKAFASFAKARANAILITGDALFTSGSRRLISLAALHAIPAIHSEDVFVESGGLMKYGANLNDAYRQVGIYTGRILKGEAPSQLPVIRASKVSLSINLKTAKSLGLTIPSSMLVQADRVIE